MDSHDSESDPRGPNETYRLTEYNREFVLTGSSDSEYYPREHERRVRRKVELLPRRIEALITDTSVLAEGGYLADEDWQDGWLELLMNEAPPAEPASPERRGAAHEALGRRLGKMLHHLVPSAVETAAVRQDILWGIIDAFYLTPGLAGDVLYGGRSERKNALVEMVESRTRHATVEDKQIEQNIDQQVDSLNWNVKPQDLQAQVHEILDDAELTARANDTLTSHLPATADIDSTAVADQAVWYLIDTEVETGTPGTYGQWQAFIQEYESESELDDLITRERVLQIIDEHRLVDRDQLRQLFEHDAARLEDKSPRHDADPVEVFKTVFAHDASPSSHTVAEIIDIPNDPSAVTTLARDWAGTRQRMYGDAWEDRPLFEGNRDGWALTAYGRALGQYLFAYDPQWQSFSTLPDDVLEAALDAL